MVLTYRNDKLILPGVASAHLDAAQKIRDEHGATLDWLYRAHRSMVPHHLAIEIARIEAAEQEF